VAQARPALVPALAHAPVLADLPVPALAVRVPDPAEHRLLVKLPVRNALPPEDAADARSTPRPRKAR